MIPTILGLIPARHGSQGIPGKNLKLLGGKPLIQHTIDLALRCPCLTQVLISSDDVAILALAHQQQIPAIRRPLHLALDTTSMWSVMTHALHTLPPPWPDLLVLLQPTAPRRTVQHVQTAVELLLTHPEVSCVMSVIPLPLTHAPGYVCQISHGYLRCPQAVRRQDVTPAYLRDGTVYVYRLPLKAGGRVWPLLLHPSASLSLDTMEDWQRAEALFRNPL